MKSENIDVKDVSCFGFSLPKDKCWLTMLRKAKGRSWKGVDLDAFEKSLASNVETSYFRLAGITFKDIATDINYFASFDNGLKYWTLEIPGSSAEAVDPKDVVDFFTSEEFKSLAKKLDTVLTKALDYYKQRVKPALEEGKLMLVDETQVEAIEYLLGNPEVRKNFRMGKYKRL